MWFQYDEQGENEPEPEELPEELREEVAVYGFGDDIVPKQEAKQEDSDEAPDRGTRLDRLEKRLERLEKRLEEDDMKRKEQKRRRREKYAQDSAMCEDAMCGDAWPATGQ